MNGFSTAFADGFDGRQAGLRLCQSSTGSRFLPVILDMFSEKSGG